MSSTDPMTEKQATFLRRLCDEHGVEFDPELTKWEASDLIKELQDEMPQKRAMHPSYKQIHATPCPECSAGKWSKCREVDGSTRPQFHQARQNAARRAAIEWRKAQDDRADAGGI